MMRLATRFRRLQLILSLLARDKDKSWEQLHARDRLLVKNAGSGLSNEALCDLWLQQRVGPESASMLFGRLPFWFWGLGALLGGLCMLGFLAYSGNRPVNVFYLLGFFVLLQWLLMGLQCLALFDKLPALPGLANISILKTSILKWQQTFLPQDAAASKSGRQTDSGYSGIKQAAGFQLPAPLLKAALLWLNQHFALAFAVTSVLCFFVVLAFEDIAFGWSTTLNISPVQLAALFDGLAWPWHSWWPDAVPDVELIRQTQYFRVNDLQSATAAATWGLWWHFLLMCLLFYQLLPRCILFACTVLRCRYLLQQQFVLNYQLSELLQRCRQPLVDTGSELGEPNMQQAVFPKTSLQGRAGLSAVAILQSLHDYDVLFWSCAADQALLSNLTVAPPSSAVVAGLGISSDADDNVQQSLLAAKHDLLLLTPGWEPPLAELADFLKPLLAVRRVFIFPYALDTQQQLTHLSEADRLSWQQFQQTRLHDKAVLLFDDVQKSGPSSRQAEPL